MRRPGPGAWSRQTGANLIGQKSNDGVDTLTNIERLQFTDISTGAVPAGRHPPSVAATVTANETDGTATLEFTAGPSDLPLTGFVIRAVPVGSVPGAPDTVNGRRRSPTAPPPPASSRA